MCPVSGRLHRRAAFSVSLKPGSAYERSDEKRVRETDVFAGRYPVFNALKPFAGGPP